MVEYAPSLTLLSICLNFIPSTAIRTNPSQIPLGSLNDGKCRMIFNEINMFPNGINQFIELTKICDLHFKPMLQFPVNMKFFKLLFISHDGYLLTSCNLVGQARTKDKSKLIFFSIGDKDTHPDYNLQDCQIPYSDLLNGQRLPIGENAPIGIALIHNPSQAAVKGVELLEDHEGSKRRTWIDVRLEKKIVENLMDFYVITTSSPYTHCQYFEKYYNGYTPTSKSVLRDWAQLDENTERSLSRCPDESKPLPTISDFHPFQPHLFVYAAPSRGSENLCSSSTPFVIEDYQPLRKNPRQDFMDGFKCAISTEDPAIETLHMISSPTVYYEKLQQLIRSRVTIRPATSVEPITFRPEPVLPLRILGDLSELGKDPSPFVKRKLTTEAFENRLLQLSPLIWESCELFQPQELIDELKSLKNPPIDPQDLMDNETCYWVEWLPTKAMRCKLCNALLQQDVIKDRPGSPKITKIMTIGQINKGPRAKTLNRGIIQRHQENPLHLQAVEFARLFQSGLRGNDLFQQFHAPGGLLRTYTNATENLLATAFALATVDLPFYRFPKVWELLVYLNASIGHLYGNPSGIKRIQMEISGMMHEDLVTHLKTEKPEFSLMIDSSTDVSSLPALAIVLQTFDSSRNVKLYLYKVLWISGRETAQILWDHFMKELEKDGLKEYVREKCVGFASDGGSNVIAFRQILKSFTNHGEKMIMVHCFAHKSELVIKNAWADQEFALSVEDTVNALHRIFGSKSAKKKRHLQLVQEEEGDPSFSIKRIQKTRWVNSRLRALDKIVLHWSTIVKALRRVLEDKTIKDSSERKLTQDTLEKLKDPSFIITTAFVADVYTAMSAMSLKLQDRGSTLIGKKEKREKMKNVLIQMKSYNGPFVQSVLDQSRFSSPQFKGKDMNVENFEKGYVIFGKIALNKPNQQAPDHALHKQRQTYINLIIEQLDKYFPEDPTDDLDILDPSHWPTSSLQSYGNENITAMNHKLKWNYDADELLQSWLTLKESVASHFEFFKLRSSMNPENFWAYYLQKDAISWSDGLRQIITNIITVPASSAEVERVFSYYTQTKTLRRYSLDVTTVDALIRIRFNGPKTLQDLDTFRYAWQFLDRHARADDTSICAHRIRGDKEQEPQLQAVVSSTEVCDIVPANNDDDAEALWNQPSAPVTPLSVDPSEGFANTEDDEIDYDVEMSEIIEDIGLEEIEDNNW